MHIVLINPYELGRQPFGVAEPAAWLKAEGYDVSCLDLSRQKLDEAVIAQADLVAVYVAMHTATRIAVEAIPRIRRLAPAARLCVYGLYAPMNESLFRDLGVELVIGGETEPALLSFVQRLGEHGSREAGCGQDDTPLRQTEALIHRSKIDFKVPDRSGLPGLSGYAGVLLPDGSSRVSGFAETTRGCKYHCRHCPVVPVYDGHFRVVPLDIVMADIRQQVAGGAEHISFGDPDFYNAPTHARHVVHALHDEFPALSYDVTIKIEHIVNAPDFLPELKQTGCLFITSAVESVDDDILENLDKGHTYKDFVQAADLLQRAGLVMAPTFVPFSPWTTLKGYVELLTRLVELNLVEATAPIQLSIRLLIPKGSVLFDLPDFEQRVQAFDDKTLGYPWRNADPAVDELQQKIQAWVEKADNDGLSRTDTFREIWRLAHEAAGLGTPALPVGRIGQPVPCLSEPWYCCAEPTSQQLNGF